MSNYLKEAGEEHMDKLHLEIVKNAMENGRFVDTPTSMMLEMDDRAIPVCSCCGKRVMNGGYLDKNWPFRSLNNVCYPCVQNASSKLDDLRKKYGVPMKAGKTYSNNIDGAARKIIANKNRDGEWNPPASQAERYDALKKAGASNWKDGFLMVEDGNLKYPFIDKNGKAMRSGIIAAKRRAATSGEDKVAQIADSILQKVDKATKKE